MRPDPARRNAWFALAALTAIGWLYYGSYYDYYFNWADEGSVALIAERLYMGERPYIDVELGYGVLWFYPISLLFKSFGVHFLTVRVWFILLGFAAALVSYALCWRLTRNRAGAFAVALLVLLFPGSGYRTYIPLLVIAGAYVLFLYDARTLKPVVAPWLALVANGAFFGIAFLIRGDIATVYGGLFLVYHGTAGVLAAIRERDPARLLPVLYRISGVVLVAAVVTLPFAMHAKAHGYLDGFLTQYSFFTKALISMIQTRFFPPPGSTAETAGVLLPRVGLLDIFSLEHTRWVVMTYVPLLVLLLVALYLCLELFKRRLAAPAFAFADFLSANMYLIVLTVGVFSAFPQFFVFRPDFAHLSEFIPGFIVLCGYFLFVVRSRVDAPARFALVSRWGSFAVHVVCIVYLVGYAIRYPEGLAFRSERPNRLQIEDRLDVYLTNWEYKVLNGLNTVIRKESGPQDYLLCFPYCPGVNFVTGRRTFQKFLYVDDSFLKIRPGWLPDMQSEIAAKKPKVIVIWNWDVNKTEISRFSNWAAPLYRQVGETYELKARIVGRDNNPSWYEVYVLK